MDFRIGFGYDSHRLSEGLSLRLGGVDIVSDFGCVAHSDGDAVIHALCDALLGAAALGDIGTHFPDNDDAYKGIDSTLLLEKTVDLLHQQGWRVNNADITIVLERPKLATYKPLMQIRLAELMRVNTDVVSVKAKTNEKMGAIGRGEGVAVTAAVTVVREGDN
ncbi:MAG: 2-C-methyl-D-erythritol 2,4-cyclodiphosphate synthase [Bacteroidales bacterium]|nr:2-C-methyl-D-erythritol 2,4-cyclodiphosphate synthase [Bacteroidales bacterium]